MRICLTLQQQATLLAWARENTVGEVNADVEPSGYLLQISVSAYPATVEAIWGTRRLELGTAEIELSGVDSPGCSETVKREPR